jgi:putative ABC transport system permease protein
MRIPLSYSLRNLWTRRLTTALTAGGLALVVFVFATVLMMTEGLEKALVETGSPDNALITRKGAGVEVQSAVERDQAALVETLPGIATDDEARPLVSKETVVLITLVKKSTGVPTNVTTRGLRRSGVNLRPQVRITKGRWFRPDSTEIVVGASIAKRFPEASLGQALRFGQRAWTVVGVFDAGGTGFDSEVWGDADQLMQAFRRVAYSSVLVKLRDNASFDKITAALKSDPRLTLEAKRENAYYLEQSEALAKFLSILGLALSVIFSIGAVIGAMITMYAAVANRTSEVGTLRALGFRRSSILWGFLLESVLLSLLGGAIGVTGASFLQMLTISTMNWNTFAELAFGFTLTPGIVMWSLAFSLVMGLLGGVLPAARAARLGIVDALRAA